jgi:pimeloyl-ACP methyl ester carboxylesterase
LEQHYLSYNSSNISYLRFGYGPKWVVCFHGFDENSTSFAFLEKYASVDHSFIAIDLPYHGNSSWNEGSDCSPSQFSEIIDQVLERSGAVSKQRLSLTFLGFSLGGRIALSLYQLRPASIDKLVLLAPDGLKLNFWYWLATQTLAGNRLFSFTMRKPAWFFGLLKILNKTGTVNSSVFKFVRHYIGDKEIRRLLYARWTTLRRFKPSLRKIKSLIIANKTDVKLVYGKHDRIILPVRGEKFRKGIESQCTISVIQSGHQVLHEKHIEDILPALLH